MVGMRGDEFLDGGDEGGAGGLHVGSAATIEHAILDGGLEGRRVPFIHGASRHDIGMTSKYQQRAVIATSCIEVVYFTETHALNSEAERLQAFDHDFLTARIFRRIRAASNQIFSEF